jgi:hypothetical protein
VTTWSLAQAAEHLANHSGRRRVATVVERLGLPEDLVAEDVVVVQAILVADGTRLTDELEVLLAAAVRATLASRAASAGDPLHVVFEPTTGLIAQDVTEDRCGQQVEVSLARAQAVLVLPVTAWRQVLEEAVREAAKARADLERLVAMAEGGGLPDDLRARLRQALDGT